MRSRILYEAESEFRRAVPRPSPHASTTPHRSKNYYETLQAHGVKSELHLVPPEDQSCFCVGNPHNDAAAGSPWAHECALPTWGKDCGVMGGKECCIQHTMGFADMVRPAVEFVLDVMQE